jgi:5-methylcytosine-specific restriction protein A
MPMKPLHACGQPGCAALTDKRFCPAHQRAFDSYYNKNLRDPAERQRYGADWRRTRVAYLRAHPLCEACLERGLYIAATDVHHMTPLSRGGTHDVANLQALCHACHSSVTAREGGRWGG